MALREALVQKTYQRYQMDSAFAATKRLPFETTRMQHEDVRLSNGLRTEMYDSRTNFVTDLVQAGFSKEAIKQQLKKL